MKCIVCSRDCTFSPEDGGTYFCGGELENPVPGKDPIHFLRPVTLTANGSGKDAHIFLSGYEISLYDDYDVAYIYGQNQFAFISSSSIPPPKLKYPKDKLKWGNEKDLIDQLNKLFILI